ncbi:methyl-accepting chemotaxis protein, partial [Aliiglaciecola sp.]|nr:methyl-accepting chemotaxis protein [Aliiglaciecola sp.]
MGNWLVSLCAPAKQLMAQFSYSIKFIVVSLIFIVPLILSLALLQYEYGEEIRFTEKEIEGLQIVNKTSVENKSLAEALINGQDFSSQLINNTDFGVLSSNAIDKRLVSYKRSFEQQDLNQSFAALIQVTQSVADYSNLELDLALSTSYLVTTLVETLPQAQAQLAKTAQLGRAVLESGSFTPETYIGLSGANQKLSLAIMNVDESIRVSLEANSDISQQLASKWQGLRKDLYEYQNLIQSTILDPDSFEISQNDLQQRSLATNQRVFEFATALSPVLAQQLEQRISDAAFKNTIILLISIVAVLLAG